MSSGFSFPRCVCADEGSLWSADNILQCQKASDFLISLAYFSIPLELFYFVSCSAIFPFRWLFLQFGAFIVLCGLTHFLNVWTYAPHSFQLMLSVTVLKFLTALVSCATSITLATLLPQMLRVMVREGLLRKKTRELGREVGIMKRREEATWHVRMLTQEIRRSLDRHTILYTTLVQLSKLLFLRNCAVWMPDNDRSELILTHQLDRLDGGDQSSIPIDDPDVMEIVVQKEPVVLRPESRLRRGFERGSAAAVRFPMLRVKDFSGGTPEVVDTRYGVLVLVLRPDGGREWGSPELDLVEVVADQVAVALSHAAVLEESVVMREKLIEQNMDLKWAGKKVLLASEASSAFRKVMRGEMAGRVRSLSSVLSVLQREERLDSKQLRMIDGMSKGVLILSSLIEDALDSCSNPDSRHELLDLNPFSLHSLLKEAVGIAKVLCNFRGLSFQFDVLNQVPEFVIGDEKRLLKAVMYMVGNVAGYGDRGNVVLRVCAKGGGSRESSFDDRNLAWKQQQREEFVELNFEVSRIGSTGDVLAQKDGDCSGKSDDAKGLSLAVCEKLAQLMHGSMSVSSNPQVQLRNMNFTIRLQLKRSLVGVARLRHMGPESPESLLNGMNILMADGDSFNQFITRKLLEKTGCHLTVVSSWYQCLETLHQKGSEFQLLLLDICIFEETIHEMTALIRRLHPESRLLIVAMTSKEIRATRNRCLQNGMNGVIGKPVVLREMVDELQRIVKKMAQVPSPPPHTEQKS